MGIVSRSQAGGGTAIARAFSRKTAGDYALNNVAFTNVDTSTDCAVVATAGDVLMANLSSRCNTEAVNAFLDVATIVAGAPVNYFSGGTGAAGDFGIAGWVLSSGVAINVGGPAFYTVQAGDISAGIVTCRLRYRTSAAAVKTLRAGTSLNDALFFGVVNLRQ